MRTALHRPLTSGYRPIRDGSAYAVYFPPADKEDHIIIRDGEVDDTVQLMKKVVWRYIGDTKQLAPLLKRDSLKATCQALWEFVYTHVQYKIDQRGLEQLRRPARAWADRQTGVDCDCMSIFISSVLTNLQIPHRFRITKYGKPQWQHVYVVVPREQGTGHYTLDAVVSQFNYEKPYTAKKDFSMDMNGIDVAVLSGYDQHDALSEALFGLDGDEELGALTDEQQQAAIYRHLQATRTAIGQNPALIASVDDPQGFLQMLDYALKYWHTDKRQQALAHLARYENQLNIKNGFAGDDDLFGDSDESLYGDLTGYDHLDELGALKPKKLFKSVGKAVKKAGKVAVKATKAVTKTVLKFNPLTISARAGFLLSMKMNLKKMGSKLKWAYATQEQAAKKGISAAQWKQSKDALAKIEKVFVSKLQGKPSALRNAVLKGKAGNLDGVVEYREGQELGELGILPAAALAAAVPIVKVVLDILKKTGLMKPGEDSNADNLANEIANDPSVTSAMQSLETEDADMKLVPATTSASSVPMVASSADAAGTQTENVTSGSGGIMNFIKANPIPSLLIGGVVAFGAYKLLSPKKKASGGLSGVRTGKKKKKATRKHPAKKRPIKKMKLF